MRWRFARQLALRLPLYHPPPQRFLSCRSGRATSSIANNSKPFPSIASLLGLSPSDHDPPSYPVQVTGHVRTIRNQKRLSFVELGDGSTSSSLQALLSPSQAIGVGTGTAVTITGLWRPCPPGKEQAYELHAENVTIVGGADPEVIFQAYTTLRRSLQSLDLSTAEKYHTADYLRTIPHLRLRTPLNALIARLRSDCEFYISNFLRASEFIRVHPPIITSSDCEGAGEVFTVQPGHKVIENGGDFFRTSKYLTVSSQLHLEAFVHEHPRVWTLSPTFRAEKSDTPRHLSEFYMLELEMRTQNIQEVMDMAEKLIRDIADNLQSSQVGQELLSIRRPVSENDDERQDLRIDYLHQRWSCLMQPNWPRITFKQAIDLLQNSASGKRVTFQYEPNLRSGLQLEHERFIAAEVGQGSPVFVTDYPSCVKPFYMLPTAMHTAVEGEMQTVACFDLLLPETCEVVGGSLREHRLRPLMGSMQQHGLLSKSHVLDDREPLSSTHAGNLDWYLDLRRFGSIPHGGFGLGFDRLMSYLAGVENIRDVVPWPRYFGRCDG